MKNRLSVASDQFHPRKCHAKFPARTNRGVGERHAQAEIQLTDFSRGARRTFGDPQYFRSQNAWHAPRRMPQQLAAQSRRRSFHFRQRHINSIRRRPAHHADHQHSVLSPHPQSLEMACHPEREGASAI
jgi:hypothetical protein